jgi:Holliday junction resolvase RusA-like endonuclease
MRRDDRGRCNHLLELREETGGEHVIRQFFVAGIPAPKGSTRGFPFRRKNGKLGVSTTNANPKTADWQQRVATEAQALGLPCCSGPVEMTLTFVLPKPKYLLAKKYAGKVVRPIKKLDLDKLIRAVLDGMTGILYQDDGQVWAVNATKQYADGIEPCGVHIDIFAQEG